MNEYRETGHVSFLNAANVALGAMGVVGEITMTMGRVKNFRSMRGEWGGRRDDFYVKPNGDVIPSTAYRYMSSDNASDTLNKGKQYTTYIGFEKFDSATQARKAFQVSSDWSDCKVRETFDTLQVIDDMYVTATLGNTATIPEPFAIGYPEYGMGGTQQFRVDKIIEFLEVKIIGK